MAYLNKEELIEDFSLCGADKELVGAIIHRINLHDAADVAEVKHGKWIVKTEFKIPLSRAYIYKTKFYICPYCAKEYRQKMNFCGHCGAKMDGKTPKKHFTREEVFKMSPTEVKENCSDILDSMKKWK